MCATVAIIPDALIRPIFLSEHPKIMFKTVSGKIGDPENATLTTGGLEMADRRLPKMTLLILGADVLKENGKRI